MNEMLGAERLVYGAAAPLNPCAHRRYVPTRRSQPSVRLEPPRAPVRQHCTERGWRGHGAPGPGPTLLGSRTAAPARAQQRAQPAELVPDAGGCTAAASPAALPSPEAIAAYVPRNGSALNIEIAPRLARTGCWSRGRGAGCGLHEPRRAWWRRRSLSSFRPRGAARRARD